MMFFALGGKCGPSGLDSATGLPRAPKSFSFSNEAKAIAPMPVPHCWKNLRRVMYLKVSKSRGVILSLSKEIHQDSAIHCRPSSRQQAAGYRVAGAVRMSLEKLIVRLQCDLLRSFSTPAGKA